MRPQWGVATLAVLCMGWLVAPQAAATAVGAVESAAPTDDAGSLGPRDDVIAAHPQAPVAVLSDDGIDPDRVEVAVGETVVWVVEGTMPHRLVDATDHGPTPTACDEEVDGCLASGEAFARTFDRPGTYEYLTDHAGDEGPFAGVVVVSACRSDPEDGASPDDDVDGTDDAASTESAGATGDTDASDTGADESDAGAAGCADPGDASEDPVPPEVEPADPQSPPDDPAAESHDPTDDPGHDPDPAPPVAPADDPPWPVVGDPPPDEDPPPEATPPPPAPEPVAPAPTAPPSPAPSGPAPQAARTPRPPVPTVTPASGWGARGPAADSAAGRSTTRGFPEHLRAQQRSVVRTPSNSTDTLLELGRVHGLDERTTVETLFGRFPVGGKATWSHDWWFPRFGPSWRLHEGTDVFAAHGTPVRAPADGTVRISHGTLGGLSVKVTEPDGTMWYLAHLSGTATGLTDGDRVRVGDTVGFVGNSGNAATTPPHLHIGVYPRGGEPTDPKPILDAMVADALAEAPARLAAAGAEPRPAAVAGRTEVEVQLLRSPAHPSAAAAGRETPMSRHGGDRLAQLDTVTTRGVLLDRPTLIRSVAPEAPALPDRSSDLWAVSVSGLAAALLAARRRRRVLRAPA